MENKNNTTVPTSNSTFYGTAVNAPDFNLGLVIVLGALIPLTIIGNCLVCFAFLKYQKVRTATNCFLFSLALSDLAVGFLLIPLWIAFIVTGGFPDLPEQFRDGYYMLDITCSLASIANLAGVSLERWYGVCYPFRHMSMTINYAILSSMASWIYALAVASLSLFDDQKNSWVIPTTTSLGLFLPFVIMIMSYCAIARTIKQKAFDPSQQFKKQCKTIRTLVLLSTIFVLCWLPLAIGSFVVNYCDVCRLYVLEKSALHIFPKVLHYANSCVNPILYSLFSPSFKSAFQQMFFGRRPNGMRRRSTLITDPGASACAIKRKSNGSVVLTAKKKSYPSDTPRGSLLNEKILQTTYEC
jgi:hypothetical protein